MHRYSARCLPEGYDGSAWPTTVSTSCHGRRVEAWGATVAPLTPTPPDCSYCAITGHIGSTISFVQICSTAKCCNAIQGNQGTILIILQHLHETPKHHANLALLYIATTVIIYLWDFIHHLYVSSWHATPLHSTLCAPQLPIGLVIGAMTGLCAAEESFKPHFCTASFAVQCWLALIVLIELRRTT